MVALPGTQGFTVSLPPSCWRCGPASRWHQHFAGYHLPCLWWVWHRVGPYVSAVYQGHASAAGIALVARREDAAGQAILFPALVETYAVVALLAAILFILWLTNAGTPEAPSNVLEYIGGAKRSRNKPHKAKRKLWRLTPFNSP